MTQEQQLFFEEFYRAHFKALVIYAYRFLKDWDDAKEITQEAFLTGLLKIDQFYGSESHIGWIKKVIWKKTGNLNKVKTYRAAVTIPMENSNVIPTIYDCYTNIDSPSAHCAELLSAQEFSLIKQVFMDGIPYRKVAERLCISESACRKRVERIIKKLRANWDMNN